MQINKQMKKIITVGSDFSGVGAFDQALRRISIKKDFKIRNVFACDMDKFARQSYLANYDPPEDYPKNVYDRKIPKESLDVYMTSPPCQSFSLAGKRKGKEDKRGVLFFNSWEFIDKNRPRFFIFENVKGLLSDDEGRTFREWCNMLGGLSVNGVPVVFPFEESVPYHIYFKVVNSKKHGIPQNRERIFIVGIRDDEDNSFTFPKEEHLKKRLKDVLEEDVDEKYFLNKSNVEVLIAYNKRQEDNNRGFSAKFRDVNEVKTMDALKCGGGGTYDLIKVDTGCQQGVFVLNDFNKSNGVVVCGNLNGGKWDKTHEQSGRVYSGEGCSPTINTMGGGNLEPKIIHDNSIRRLTPRECFRLQDFPEDFKFVVSDSQLYKQAGNSITVRPLEIIINKLQLIRK